jgi:hypothetical protein
MFRKKSPDPTFTESFKQKALILLKAGQRGPNKIALERVEIALIGEGGKPDLTQLSRVFDRMTVPCATTSAITATINKKYNGSYQAYMLKILQELAPTLLTTDHSRINDATIAAIGINNYAQLVGGEVKEGKVIPKSGDEVAFKAREREVAKQMMSAVVLNYGQAVKSQTLSHDEQLLETANKEISVRLLAMSDALKEVMTEEEESLLSSAKDDITKSNPKDVREAIEMVRGALEKIPDPLPSDKEELKALYLSCYEAHEGTQPFINEIITTFTQKFVVPLQAFQTQFHLDMLKTGTTDALKSTSGQEVTEYSEKEICDLMDHFVRQINSQIANLDSVEDKALISKLERVTDKLENDESSERGMALDMPEREARIDKLQQVFSDATKLYAKTMHENEIEIADAPVKSSKRGLRQRFLGSKTIDHQHELKVALATARDDHQHELKATLANAREKNQPDADMREEARADTKP